MSDDYGAVKGPALLLKSQFFPLNPEITIQDIQSRLQALIDADKIAPFKKGKKEYYHIKDWKDMQKVNNPSIQRNPSYPGDNPVDDEMIEPFD